MKEYRNIVDLEGAPLLVTYLADENFEEIELLTAECNGINIPWENIDKDLIIKQLT